jgi:hypothetical protein
MTSGRVDGEVTKDGPAVAELVAESRACSRCPWGCRRAAKTRGRAESRTSLSRPGLTRSRSTLLPRRAAQQLKGRRPPFESRPEVLPIEHLNNPFRPCEINTDWRESKCDARSVVDSAGVKPTKESVLVVRDDQRIDARGRYVDLVSRRLRGNELLDTDSPCHSVVVCSASTQWHPW